MDIYVVLLDYNSDTTDMTLFLHNELKLRGVTIIPMAVTDFHKLQTKNFLVVLSIVKDIQSRQKFNILGKKFLEMAVRNKKLGLIDVTSFSTNEKIRGQTKNYCYQHISLPCELKQITEEITRMIETHKALNAEWIGGKKHFFAPFKDRVRI